MVMMAISSRASGCWDSLGCPYGIFFERDPWKRTKIRAVLDRISTGSRTRVPGSRLNGGNPPLVSPMGLVWHQSPPYIPFSFSSTPHRGRSPSRCCAPFASLHLAAARLAGRLLAQPAAAHTALHSLRLVTVWETRKHNPVAAASGLHNHVHHPAFGLVHSLRSTKSQQNEN